MGDLDNLVEKERMWHEIIKEYGDMPTTRAILTQSKKLIEFEDGTVIEMVQAGDIRGKRFTHLYVSENLLKIHGRFLEYVEDNFLPFAKSKNERTKVFSLNKEKLLEIKNI